MDRDLALTMLRRFRRMESLLNGLGLLCRKMPGPQSTKYRKLVSGLYICWAEMLASVVKEYPDLAPEKHREWLRELRGKPVESVPWLLSEGDWLAKVSRRRTGPAPRERGAVTK